MKSRSSSQPESNHRWTHLDTNDRTRPFGGFHPCSSVLAVSLSNPSICGSLRFFLGLAAAALLPLGASAAESPSVLLQKAIFAEETEGNLDSAIKIYEQIAAEAATNRAVVAQAQYRLAVCYQKKGNKDQAIKLLTDLVEQSPTDAEIGRKSKEVLAALGVRPGDSPAARQISLPLQTNWFVSISANGRFVAYEPRDTRDLVVTEVGTGKTWTVFKGTKETSLWDAWLSPDGQRIAYQTSAQSITAVEIGASETKVLYDASREQQECWMYGWGSDGREICLWIYDPDPKKRPEMEPVFALDLATSVKREIMRIPSKPKAGNGPWIVSPDNTTAIHITRDYPRRIGLWDLKTGNEDVLLSREAGDVFGWFANGTKVLYTRRRLQGVELLAATVKGGKPVGKPEQIWTIPGEAFAEAIGEDGSVYYSAPRDTSEAVGVSGDRLWVIEGLLNRKVPVTSLMAEIPPEELLGPDNSIQDRKYGLSFTLPKDWTIGGTRMRDREQRGIFPNVPALPKVRACVWYGVTDKNLDVRWNPVGKKPTTDDEIETWLHERARLVVTQRVEQHGFDDFANRPESFVSRMIGDHRALSWSADFTREGQKWSEYDALVFGKEIYAWFWVMCPPGDIGTVKPAFDGMMKTVRLP